MRSEPGDALHRARRLSSQRKAALVLAAIQAGLQRGQALTVAGVAREAGVGRKFIYDHPDLRAEIELKAAQAAQRQGNDMIASARVSGASLRADLENTRAQAHRLQRQVRALEARLSQLEGGRLIAGGAFPQEVVADLADQRLAHQIVELELQVFNLTAALRGTNEELDAARLINRELMQQANRADGGNLI